MIFRAPTRHASGDAFVGDWLTGGVHTISAWFYQETGETLTPFIRFATSFNFPGAVINDTDADSVGRVDRGCCSTSTRTARSASAKA